jgi:hypothetical protein
MWASMAVVANTFSSMQVKGHTAWRSKTYFKVCIMAMSCGLAACQNASTDYLLGASYIKLPLSVSPAEASVVVLKTLQFITTGGAPPYTYKVFSGNGQISGSVYTAPSSIGTAVVSVKDAAGTSVAALITIVTDSNCPTNYIPVPKNTAVGTTADFCVSKYEMKCNNDSTGAACTGSPVSMAANQPWVNVIQANAKTLCAGLGTQYHLITNSEWMTIARGIEATASNWSSGTVSSGALNRGHSDNSPAATLAASTDDNPCSGTGDTCSSTTFHDQRRTHVISNGHILWDFSGNAREYIDWFLPTGRSASGSAGYIEINAQVAGASMALTTFKSNDTGLTSGNGIGQYWPDTDGSNGYASRGGSYTNGSNQAGVYQLDFGNGAALTQNRLSFRCAYQ